MIILKRIKAIAKNIVLLIGAITMLNSIPAGAAEPVKIDPPQNQAGYRAYIDPDSGQLTSSPPQQARKSLSLDSIEQNAMSTSDTGLSQEHIPGKGVKLDLQGRFQSSTFATIGESGEVSISHNPVNKPSSNNAQNSFKKQGN